MKYPQLTIDLIQGHAPIGVVFDSLEDAGFKVEGWRKGHRTCLANTYGCSLCWAIVQGVELTPSGDISSENYNKWIRGDDD